MNKDFAGFAHVAPLLASGADLLISISGGKDSDCLARELITLHKTYGFTGRVALVHSDLGSAEHLITPAYIQRFVGQFPDVPFHLLDGGDLIDLMYARHDSLEARGKDAPPFPSARARYCTSTCKRDVINRFIRSWSPTGIVISADGIRAEESRKRRTQSPFEVRDTATTKKRAVFDWHPLHQYTLAQVWGELGYTLDELATIQKESQDKTPQQVFDEGTFNAHPAYALGNQRLSCAICILGSKGDMRRGATQDPALYRRLVDLEIKSEYSFQDGIWLGDLMPHLLTEAQQAALDELRPRQLGLGV